jgi:putative flippase GtrA
LSGARGPIQLLRYVLVVGAAAVIDLGGFVILVRAGLPVPISAASSFTIAAVFNYLVSARYVFRQTRSTANFVLFFAVGLVGLSVNSGITSLVYSWGAPSILAKTVGIGVTFFVNALMNFGIVFRRRRSWRASRR